MLKRLISPDADDNDKKVTIRKIEIDEAVGPNRHELFEGKKVHHVPNFGYS